MFKRLNMFLEAPVSTTLAGIRFLYGGVARFGRLLLVRPLRFLAFAATWLGGRTVLQLWAVSWRAFAVLAVLITAGLFAAIHFPHSQIPDVRAANPVVYLDQGWGPGREAPDRQTYYWTPQGTGDVLRHMRYDWFVNLELPWGTTRFADPEHLLAYGFQIDPEISPANPHHLPVGFTRHFDARLGEDVLDITCAACHTGGLDIRKEDGSAVTIRIDGGQGMHAFTAANMPHFVPVLVASMTSTLLNPLKFKRFGLNVLGPAHYESGKSALRDELKKTYFALLKMGMIEQIHAPVAVEEGFARTDALTRIGNAVFGDHIKPGNYRPIDAPVSYPAVWDIWKFDWVQYSGSVAQPMARNLGESLGVGTTYDFYDSYQRPLPRSRRYDTSTRIEDLHKIEQALRRLRPPVWREDVMGEVNQAKAVAGGVEFIRTCQGCHGPHPAGARQKKLEAPLKGPNDPHWRMKLMDVYEIGTDAHAALNFVRRTFDLTPTGLDIAEVRELVGEELSQRTERELRYDYGDDLHGACASQDAVEPLSVCAAWASARRAAEISNTQALDAIDLAETTNGQGLNYYGLLMKKKLYKEAGYSNDEIQDLNGFGALDLPQVKMIYKARTLGGVWATAPYLHNGSVRNLYQMLSPQVERDRKFFIGRPEIDTKQVGLKPGGKNRGGFWLDTSIEGNTNTGHEFRDGYSQWKPGNAPQFGVIGPAYTPEQRYEIIEYLKTHLDDPPHSDLFTRTFTGIVGEVVKTMPAFGVEAAIEEHWKDGQACNLAEYLRNHAGAAGLDDRVTSDIAMIQSRLEAYFALPGSYQCGGKTRYQRGAEDYD